MVRAREDESLDPTQIPGAVKDAGFGPGEIRLKARGVLAVHSDLLALRLPSAPGLLVLAGGERFDELEESGLPIGSRVLVEGKMHPSHADRPPGMEVQRWEELERVDAGEPRSAGPRPRREKSQARIPALQPPL